jgi:hypothetical protein
MEDLYSHDSLQRSRKEEPVMEALVHAIRELVAEWIGLKYHISEISEKNDSALRVQARPPILLIISWRKLKMMMMKGTWSKKGSVGQNQLELKDLLGHFANKIQTFKKCDQIMKEIHITTTTQRIFLESNSKASKQRLGDV